MRKLILATTGMLIAAAITSASAATGSTKTEHFSFLNTSTSSTKPVYSVIGTGDFIAGGTAAAPGKVKGMLTLHLTGGTITLDLKRRHRAITKTETATACVQTDFSVGSYTIAGGTGAYSGISGKGHATSKSTFVEQVVHGNCSDTFAAVQGLITASGPVSLP